MISGNQELFENYDEFPKEHLDVVKGTLLVGDALTKLKELPDQSVRCCITSPPYWGLRDYGISEQIGAELDLNEFLDKLVEVFREVRRVLTDDGTFWLNIGDSFTSGGRTWRQSDKKNTARGMDYRPPTPPGLKPKDLIGVPWRLAFKLQEDGWYLRTDIIWHKPNGQPESVKDRPTRVHEFIFMFSKKEKYFYNIDAVQEPSADGKTRRRRSVWNINTKGFKGAHFAVFPTELVKVCMKAGSEAGDTVLDPFIGSGTVGVVAEEIGRNWIGIELNEEYAEIAKERLKTA
ncbi:site-specific DNA-methyltransferase [Salmonella enterica]|nr:site-specific DNA-methyltransferase [Salmonella enterica]MBA2988694.1 site-specific DNA-methyltransferase [Salmonella enterica subsp. arizonae serovar 47:z4,z23:-]HAS1783710.1 site-specific DNA-methyltransferase [Enterobacter pasteurii]EAZ4733344.1 site-specific DNA-methyltransferase [Salmonella enterica]EEC2697880.1 site-specific DNA-methyltransferase [Salmonella enterica]